MFHAGEGLKINRKSDSGPYPRKLPKVLRTHQVALEREKAERYEERGPGWLKVLKVGIFTPSFGFISSTAEATLAQGEGEGLLG